MEHNKLSNPTLADQESFRHSLHSSLSDVLGQFGGGGFEPKFGINQPFGASTVMPPLPHRSSALSASAPSSLLMQALGINRNTMPYKSPPCFASQLEFQINQEVLLKQAEKRLAEAQTAVLLQRMEVERRQESLRDALLLRLLQSRRDESQPPSPPLPIITDPNLKHFGGVQLDSLMSMVVKGGSPTAITSTTGSLSIEEQVKTNKRKQNSFTIHALGNHRRNRHDPFIDCLDIDDPNEAHPIQSSSHRRSRGGVSSHFPERLHQMLIDLEDNGHTEIVSFFSHGRAFCVHDMDRFVSDIMPKYFKQSKWSSFARQLNLYGFVRIANGSDAGGYFHELFLRSRPSLCLHMRRVGVPQGYEDRRKCRPKNVSEIMEPDFYSMKKSLRAQESSAK